MIKKILVLNGVELCFIKIPRTSSFFGDNFKFNDRKYKLLIDLDEYYILDSPVTQHQFSSIIGHNPSLIELKDAPVINVNYFEAKSFCQFLTNLFVDWKFDLPTEFQWEYAARGGEFFRYAGSDNLKEVGWYIENSNCTLKNVKELKPNAYEIFDMSGGVMEWTRTNYKSRYSYTPWPFKKRQPDLQSFSESNNKVIRGGGFLDDGRLCSVYSRSRLSAQMRPSYVGFRIVMNSKN